MFAQRFLRLIGFAVMVFIVTISVGSIAAQQDGTSNTLLVITEEELNNAFMLPSRDGFAVSGGAQFDLADGSVHFSVNAVISGVNREQELSIIAILIGQVRGRGYQYRLENVMISSLAGEPVDAERISFNFIAAAFNRYIRSQIRDAGIRQPYEIIINGDQLEVVAR